MKSGMQARADWRALMSAAFIGSGVGLALGGVYLGAGLGQAVIDHSQTVQVAQADAGTLPASALRPTLDAQAPALTQPQLALAPSPRSAAVAAFADAKPSRARELECLTQAVYFEARGESHRGQQAVATVIMNRVKNPKFPSTICGVVYQGAGRRHGCQFSFACDGRVERVVERTAWERARKVAARALSGAVLRDVGSATHFHTTAVAPDWGPRMLRTAQVGLHVFYRFNPHARPAAPKRAPEAPTFVSAPLTQPVELRLASAVLAPADAAAKPASAAVAELKPDIRPLPDLKPIPKPEPIAKLDAPSGTKPEPAAS